MPERATIAALRARLAAFAPLRLEIEDESARHAGHAGSLAGGHFHLVLESEAFRGRSALERHRMVYDCLGDLAALRIHALSMQLRAPQGHGDAPDEDQPSSSS